MDKVCNFCGNKHFRSRRVQYVYRRADRYLIVNNVPCEECEFCGEQYFEASALKKIEADFDSIHLAGKEPGKSIRVPVEEYAEL